MRCWKMILAVVIGWGVFSATTTAQATTVNHEQIAIRKVIKRDMGPVHGRWSVKVTRLGQQPLAITAGNKKVQGQRSASTIKVYVMLTIFQRVRTHHLKLTKAVKSELGRMIHNSDNAATNRLIHRLGGFKRVNQTMKSYGFNHSHLRRYMMDTRALRQGHDNYTSVNDLTRFLTLVSQHKLLGKVYDGKMMTLLHHCKNHSKLPKLVKHAAVYNKTGEFPAKGVQNDASLFRTKHGTYTVVVMAQQGKQAQQYRAMNRLGRDTVKYLDSH